MPIGHATKASGYYQGSLFVFKGGGVIKVCLWGWEDTKSLAPCWLGVSMSIISVVRI